MSNVTSIEWCDRTANPVYAINTETGKRGHMCVHASPGCENCYAETWNGWRGNGLKFRQQDLARAEFRLKDDEILSWARLKKPGRIFVGDMTDLFGPWVPDGFLRRIFIGMALAPRQTFLLLTKRPERMAALVGGEELREYVQAVYDSAPADLPPWQWPLPNVWLGTSVEDQRRADERIPHLLATPAAVRFISAEPLLGPVDLSRYLHLGRCKSRGGGGEDLETGKPFTFRCGLPEGHEEHHPHHALVPTGAPWWGLPAAVDWVIGGGESGASARPFDLQWARDLVAQCRAADVACFVKQLGARPFTRERRDAHLPAHVLEAAERFGVGPLVEEFTEYRLQDRKGGDWSEWPSDLRVREFPEVRA